MKVVIEHTTDRFTQHRTFEGQTAESIRAQVRAFVDDWTKSHPESTYSLEDARNMTAYEWLTLSEYVAGITGEANETATVALTLF